MGTSCSKILKTRLIQNCVNIGYILTIYDNKYNLMLKKIMNGSLTFMHTTKNNRISPELSSLGDLTKIS